MAWHGMARQCSAVRSTTSSIQCCSIQCCLASCCREVHLHAHSICSAMVALWNLWLNPAHAHFVLSVLLLVQCSLAAGCTKMGRHRGQVPRDSLLLLVRLTHTLHCKDMLCKHDLAQLKVAIVEGGTIMGFWKPLYGGRKPRQSKFSISAWIAAPS